MEPWLIENVMDVPATTDAIDARFIELREAPISVFGFTIDCDSDSITAMQAALRYFDDQPEIEGVIETVNNQKHIMWKMTDNSLIPLTKEFLASVVDEVARQKTIRTELLYARKQQFKKDSASYRQISSTWL